MTDYPWAITDADGGVLDRFATEQEVRDALDSGDYPDDAEPAYINEPEREAAFDNLMS